MTTTTQKLQVATDAPILQARAPEESAWEDITQVQYDHADANGFEVRKLYIAAPSTEQAADGCPCAPAGGDGHICPDPATGKPLCSRAEQPAAASGDGPDIDGALTSLNLSAGQERIDRVKNYINFKIAVWGAQQREAGREAMREWNERAHRFFLSGMKELGLGDGTKGWVEHVDEDEVLRRDELSLEGEILVGFEQIKARIATAEKERDDLRAQLAEVETDKTMLEERLSSSAQLARPDLASVETKVWWNAEHGHAVYNNQSGEDLILRSEVQALLAGGAAPVSGQEPAAWITEKNLAAIKGKGMAYATGFDIGGQIPLYRTPQPAAKADAPAEELPVPNENRAFWTKDRAPAHITLSQVGIGQSAQGYVSGWNDCVDAMAGKP